MVLRGERISNDPDLLDNLQAWVENKYDTRLLHSNLAFPLLERLADGGDKEALVILREEIIVRLRDGFPSVVNFLYEQDYVGRYLSREDIFNIFLNPDEVDKLLKLEKISNIEFFHNINNGPNTFMAKNGRVTRLNLSVSSLKGIPDIINQFDSLERIIIWKIENQPHKRMKRIRINGKNIFFDEVFANTLNYYFEAYEGKININKLAELLNISQEGLLKILRNYSNEIEEIGIILRIEGGQVVKE